MKLNLKYNATKVDEIEKARNLPIENCITDSSIAMLVLFIQKGLVTEGGSFGVTRSVALETIDNYLAENDKTELMLDIMEGLIDGGFLSRELDVESLRQTKLKRETQVKEVMMNEM